MTSEASSTTASSSMPETKGPLIVAVGSTNPAKIRAVEQALRTCLSKNTNNIIGSNDENTNDPTPSTLIRCHGFSVSSGVADQPVGDDDTRQGAQNRALAAYHAYTQQHKGKTPHLAVGMEGGVEWIKTITTSTATESTTKDGDNNKKDQRTLYCMAWMAIYGTRTALTNQLFANSFEATSHTTHTATPPSTTTTITSQSSNIPTTEMSSPTDTPNTATPIWGIAKTANFPLPPEIVRLMTEEGLELGDADDQVFGRIKSKHGSGTVGVLTHNLIDRSAYYEHALILALIPWMRPKVFPYQTQQ